MREIIAVKGKPLAIGYEGENEAVQLVLPIAVEWQKLYGDGTFTILMQRPTEENSYPKVTTVDGNKVSCVIDSADVSILGMGAVIVRYMVGDTIAKSEIYSTRIRGSIGAEGEVPEPYQAWVDEVLSASVNVGEAVERAETARNEAVEAKEASDNNRSITAQLADSAEQSADDAEQSADSAEASARRAEEAAESAESKEPKKLIAEYGVTPVADIVNAINNGDIVLCRVDGRLYRYIATAQDLICFSGTDISARGTYVARVSAITGIWSKASYSMVDNVTNPNAYWQFPTVLAVTDYVNSRLVKLTQAEYDAIAIKDENTVYFIIEE